jgi:hypothetical protein
MAFRFAFFSLRRTVPPKVSTGRGLDLGLLQPLANSATAVLAGRSLISVKPLFLSLTGGKPRNHDDSCL